MIGLRKRDLFVFAASSLFVLFGLVEATPPMSEYLRDRDVRILHGDAVEQLASLPDASVDCCVTSPPYWGLRDYGVPGQLGLEASPEEYVSRMVEVFAGVRRVLKDSGTLWLNLGDSYVSVGSGIQGANGEMATRRVAQVRDRKSVHGTVERPPSVQGLAPKNLIGVPWRVAFALQADGWYLRSDIIWAKPNPMPESVTDRPTKAHEYVFLLSKSPRYFFDQEAVRERYQGYDGRRVLTREAGLGSHENHRNGKRDRWPGLKAESTPRNDGERWNEANGRGFEVSGVGRNVRSVWEIATQPYPEAHFATYPEELARRCILAGTSERGVCPECGKPWEREIGGGHNPYPGSSTDHTQDGKMSCGAQTHPSGRSAGTIMARRHYERTPPQTIGWRPTCNCGALAGGDRGEKGAGARSVDGNVAESMQGSPSSHASRRLSAPPASVPATVLDPFFGSGTTGLVARKHGRRCIGIELAEPYCKLAADRLAQQSLLAELSA